ncbi:hypothetical protein DL93DRAFT_403969 [Clavulina sp. PMI_390]|nr:hypothetical protein DL93DRAFT_403969 [Clavulina sp. PMI_390]
MHLHYSPSNRAQSSRGTSASLLDGTRSSIGTATRANVDVPARPSAQKGSLVGQKHTNEGCFMCRARRKKCPLQLDERGWCVACVDLRLKCPGGYGFPKPPGVKYLNAKERNPICRTQGGSQGPHFSQGSPSRTTLGGSTAQSNTVVVPPLQHPNFRPPPAPSIEVTTASTPPFAIPSLSLPPDGIHSPSTQFSSSCPPTPASTYSAQSIPLPASPAVSWGSDLSGPPDMSNVQYGEGHVDPAALSLTPESITESSSNNPSSLPGAEIYHPTSQQTSSAVSPHLQSTALPVFAPQQNAPFEEDQLFSSVISITATDLPKRQEIAERGDQTLLSSSDPNHTFSPFP